VRSCSDGNSEVSNPYSEFSILYTYLILLWRVYNLHLWKTRSSVKWPWSFCGGLICLRRIRKKSQYCRFSFWYQNWLHTMNVELISYILCNVFIEWLNLFPEVCLQSINLPGHIPKLLQSDTCVFPNLRERINQFFWMLRFYHDKSGCKMFRSEINDVFRNPWGEIFSKRIKKLRDFSQFETRRVSDKNLSQFSVNCIPWKSNWMRIRQMSTHVSLITLFF